MDGGAPISVIPEQQAHRARTLARDGWLFLGIGLLAFVAPTVAYKLTRNVEVVLPALGMGVAVFFVLTATGLFKLCRARQAGDRQANSILSGVIIGAYVVAGFLFISSALLPSLLQRYGRISAPVLSWVISSLVLSIFVIGFTRRERPGETLPVRRSAGSILLAWIGLICAFGMLDETDMQCLRSGGLLRSLMFAYGIPGGEWVERQFVYPACVLAPAAIGIFAYATTLIRLWRLDRARAHDGSYRWVLGAAWAFVLPLSALFACLLAPSQASYLGTIAAVACVLVAGCCGALIARVWQPNPSRLRFYGATLLISVLLLSVVPLTATMAGMGLQYHGGYNFDRLQPDWIFETPELLRSPIAHWLSGLSPRIRDFVYSNGLVSTGELRSRALDGAPGAFTSPQDCAEIWMRWSERDPQAALTAALNVPQSPATTIPAFNYDFGAGCVVGKHASDAEIRARLTGNYSNSFITGVIAGVGVIRASQFDSEIENALNTRTFDDRTYYYLQWLAPGQMLKHANELLDANPGPQRYSSIERSLQAYYSTAPAIRIKMRALSSSDVIVRKLALNASYEGSVDVLKKVLACAEGAMPGCDPEERRIAALRLNEQIELQIPNPFHNEYFNLKAPPPLRPLTESEQGIIDEICAKARRMLTHWPGRY